MRLADDVAVTTAIDVPVGTSKQTVVLDAPEMRCDRDEQWDDVIVTLLSTGDENAEVTMEVRFRGGAEQMREMADWLNEQADAMTAEAPEAPRAPEEMDW